ncbi:MAG: stage II sporulation protein R [Clostridia bacterium]|nr:stage II sporulation protein R [Clostridia bacterium]
MKKIQMIEISVAIGLVFSIIFSVIGFGADCREIRSNVIRLHILANSDTEEDQTVKLLVRDALLSCGSELFGGTVSIDNASEYLAEEKDKLIAKANEVLSENGFDYKADMFLTEEYFPTREYENFTLPAGEYLALKVILGKGEGHNWWCVMFPPLCLPAATKRTDTEIILGKDGAEIISSPVKYEIRFKVVEIFEEIKAKLNHTSIYKN